MFERFKKEREIKRLVIDSLNEEIMKSDEGEDSVETLYSLWEKKQVVKLNGVSAGDVLKVVANVAIVGVIIGFEMSHVMNAKASRFIKTL
jgi:hypothetical protein